MKSEPAFWDTSALVPLCVRQTQTAAAKKLYQTYEITVWWATPVEIASALARVFRMGQLNASELTAAGRIAATLANLWLTIAPSEDLRTQASTLVGRYGLRAADALQLAAALVWTENHPAGRIFLTADDKLREAAHLCGFDTSLI